MEVVYKFIKELKIEGCNIIGHSFGGRVSILLSATYKDIVGKIVLSDPAGLIPKRGVKYYIKVYTYKMLKNIYNMKFIQKSKYSLKPKIENYLKKHAGSKDYQDLNDEMKKTFLKVVNQNLRPYLKKIKSSVLLIWGENDTATPLYMGKIMEKEIKDSGLIVFKNCGHYAYLDNFNNFCLIVSNFFGGNK
jgi:pimeloyl-ACP methyl ester carboxylesterase